MPLKSWATSLLSNCSLFCPLLTLFPNLIVQFLGDTLHFHSMPSFGRHINWLIKFWQHLIPWRKKKTCFPSLLINTTIAKTFEQKEQQQGSFYEYIQTQVLIYSHTSSSDLNNILLKTMVPKQSEVSQDRTANSEIWLREIYNLRETFVSDTMQTSSSRQNIISVVDPATYHVFGKLGYQKLLWWKPSVVGKSVGERKSDSKI